MSHNQIDGRLVPRRPPGLHLKASVWLVIFSSLVAAVGCSQVTVPVEPERDQVRPATLALHLAVDDERQGLRAVKTRDGRTVYLFPQAELTRAHLAYAQALHSERRSMLRLAFGPAGAQRLSELTAANPGAYLAIFINDELVAVPRIEAAVVTGEIYLVGVFSREKTEELAEALNR